METPHNESEEIPVVSTEGVLCFAFEVPNKRNGTRIPLCDRFAVKVFVFLCLGLPDMLERPYVDVLFLQMFSQIP